MPTRISTKSSSQNVAQSPTHQLARSPFALAIIASAVTYAFSPAAEANDAMDRYEVIEVQGATPLSANSNNSAVFGNVQTLTQDDIEGSVNRSLPELLKTQLASVNLNDVQNNPFQPDLQYRGFTASPLLGLPQGISVYLNGGRVNEAFGDTVHWDLMPLDAIDTVSLYSGSNPLFGQNTLGGALALTTKTGFSFNANEIDLQAGQFGQKAASVESGGHNDHWAYYVNLNHYEEDGWRDYSPSEVQQLFTSLAYKSDKMHLDMNLFMADNELLGNGASPIELLDIEGREAVYTHPDQTNNELTHVNITGDFVLTNTLSLTANMFYRDTQTQSINGDDSDFGACQFADGRVTLCEFEDDDDDDDDPLDSDGDDDDDDDLPVVGEGDDIEAVEFIGFDDDTALAEISNVDADELDGTYNTGRTDAKATGLSFQLAKQYALSGFSSELIVGASYTKGDVNYAADTTFGILENESAQDSRTVLPIDGLMAQEARVRLDVDTTAWSLFFMNSTQLSSAVSLNLGGRFNRDHIVMEDLIDDGEGSLDGNHRFTQFNPAVGVDITIDEQSQLNLAISQSSRTPSPAELSCADEDDPCRLPNGFVADPPLDQVVTQTIEANYTTRIDNIDLMLNVFHSRSKDDIIFQQAGSVASRGYFINVDETQRQGVEFSVGSTWEKLTYRNSTP